MSKSKNFLRVLLPLSIIMGLGTTTIAAACNYIVPKAPETPDTGANPNPPIPGNPQNPNIPSIPMKPVTPEMEAKIKEELKILLKETPVTYTDVYQTRISSFNKSNVIFPDFDTKKYVSEIKRATIDKRTMSVNIDFVFKYKDNQTIVSEQKSHTIWGFLSDTVVDNRSKIQKELDKVDATYSGIKNTLFREYDKTNIMFSGFNNEKYAVKIVKERKMSFEASGFVDVTYILENKLNANDKSPEKTKRFFDFKLIEDYDYSSPDELSENFLSTRWFFPDVSNILLVDFDPNTIVFSGFNKTKYKINIFSVDRKIKTNSISVFFTLSTLDGSRETVISHAYLDNEFKKDPLSERVKFQSDIENIIVDYENRENLSIADFTIRHIKYSNFNRSAFFAREVKIDRNAAGGFLDLTFYLSEKQTAARSPQRTVRIKGFKKL